VSALRLGVNFVNISKEELSPSKDLLRLVLEGLVSFGSCWFESSPGHWFDAADSKNYQPCSPFSIRRKFQMFAKKQKL